MRSFWPALWLAVFAAMTFKSKTLESTSTRELRWPRGPMDEASAYGAGDCRLESCRGHLGVAHRVAMGANGLPRELSQ